MENHFSIQTTKSIFTKKVETIVLSDDDSLDLINEIDRKKENIYSNKKGKSNINFENIIRNNKQLVEFCLNRYITKINILNFLCAFNFKSLLQFKYLEKDEKYVCLIKSGNKKCSSEKCSSRSEAKTEAIDLFFEKHFLKEKNKIDQIYIKHKKLIFRSILPHLKENLQCYLLKNSPSKNAKVSTKDKRKSENEFDKLFYTNYNESETNNFNEKQMKEVIDSQLGDKLNFYDPDLINYLELYYTTPYKIFSTFKIEYENKLSIKEEVHQINIDQNNNIKFIINFPEMGSLFEGVSKNKKIAQELAAQKFLKKLFEPKTFTWKEFLDFYENKHLFKLIS